MITPTIILERDPLIDSVTSVGYLLNVVVGNSSSNLKILARAIREHKTQKDWLAYQAYDRRQDVRSFLKLLRRTSKRFCRRWLGNKSSSS